jgi:hypothetical protein
MSREQRKNFPNMLSCIFNDCNGGNCENRLQFPSVFFLREEKDCWHVCFLVERGRSHCSTLTHRGMKYGNVLKVLARTVKQGRCDC